MCLLVEDFIDTIQALHPEYGSMWIFDHSCGHHRGREDSLPVGIHSPKPQVRQMQKMVFQEGDAGPYYMTPINQELHLIQSSLEKE